MEIVFQNIISEGNLCDRLVSLLRRRVYQGSDFSNESFALVIALLMPVTVDIYVLIAAVLAGVLIGKEIFGGYGSYPFNPAAVGYVVAAVSWPEQVFRYPQPYTNIPLWDASMVPVSSAIEDTLRSGGMLNIGSLALGLGEYAAPMGTGAALVILACGLFLWTQKDAHIEDVIHGLNESLGMEETPEEDGLDSFLDCSVLTSQDGLFGASCILYPEAVKELAAAKGGNFFLLPSSIHEWLVIPDDGIYDGLEDIVRFVNQNEVGEASP